MKVKLLFLLVLVLVFVPKLGAEKIKISGGGPDVSDPSGVATHPGMPVCENGNMLYQWNAETGWKCVEAPGKAVPSPSQLVEVLKAERNYWERLAMANAAESKMLQTTQGKQWLAHTEYLKKESTEQTRALALADAACKTLGPDFVFVRKSLTCEQKESAALAVAGKPTGGK